MNRNIDVATSYAATLARFPAGFSVSSHLGKRPDKLLELYEYEPSPFCRKVREVLCALDLEAMIYPCPQGGTRFRPIVQEKGGKQQYPFLHDPNTGLSLYESDDIIRYLCQTYGDGTIPLLSRLGPVTTLSAGMATLWRLAKGAKAVASRAPDRPLELWSFEVSPYCRIAREALCALELPYRLHNVAKGSPSRQAFIARSGKMQVPFLFDPNTDVEMFESADIVAYLERTYASR